MNKNHKALAAFAAVNKAVAPVAAAINPSMKNFAASSLAKSISTACAPLREYVQAVNAEREKTSGGDL